jgi:thiol:disulfide interchange protein
MVGAKSAVHQPIVRHLTLVRLIRAMRVIVLLCLAAFSAQAAHTQARLILSSEVAKPGSTVLVGVLLKMETGWHTYWKNSGDSGMPTSIEWQLPPGVTAGETRWPVPEKLPEKDLTTYIYKDQVVLLVPLKLAPDLSPGQVDLRAKVSWLECDLQCLPGSAKVEAPLVIGTDPKPGKESGILTEWEKRLPSPGDGLGARAEWQQPGAGDMRPLVLTWAGTNTTHSVDFFPDSSDGFEVGGATDRLPADNAHVAIRKQIKRLGTPWPERISGVILENAGNKQSGYQVSLVIGGDSTVGSVSASSAPSSRSGSPGPSLWEMLIYAFIGGLILNVMPCVLPVIALKILGFVGQAREDASRARRLGLIYALGVVVSFLALAGLVIGLKLAGLKAGWGIQFGNPYFLVVMTTLATLIALNLFGIFEVTLSGRAMGTAAELSSRHGAAGAFFNGLLATVLATSCTAPFLGAAIGFAFAPSQTAPITLLVFFTIGIGLALPYVVLTWQPAWLRFLPKPGPWMERFKIIMGFPMLAAAAWLFSLVSLHYGDRAWWLILFLVMVSVAAWVFGEFVQRNRSRPGVAWLTILLILTSGYAAVLEGQLRWRQPGAQSAGGVTGLSNPGGVPWKPWSTAAVEAARAEQRPVLVDFTAKWCLTCNTLVKPALESSSVRTKLQQINAVALLADYTAFPQNITDELNRFDRAGVPLVLVYPKNPKERPIILPEALTPGMVVDALDRAVR